MLVCMYVYVFMFVRVCLCVRGKRKRGMYVYVFMYVRVYLRVVGALEKTAPCALLHGLFYFLTFSALCVDYQYFFQEFLEILMSINCQL